MMGGSVQTGLSMISDQMKNLAQFVPPVSAQIMMWPHEVIFYCRPQRWCSGRRNRRCETQRQRCSRGSKSCGHVTDSSASPLLISMEVSNDHDQAESPEVRTMLCPSSCRGSLHLYHENFSRGMRSARKLPCCSWELCFPCLAHMVCLCTAPY